MGVRCMSASTGIRADETAAVPATQHAEQRGYDPGEQSEQAYIDSLRRSINQMKIGDVQPVREGLEELRRELDTNVKDNSVDN